VLRLHYDLSFVEHGPVPPHERTWRHPSEVAAEERELLRAEPTPATSRAFALTTGTIGLLAIAALLLTVTPSRGAQPIAVDATTIPGSGGTDADTAAVTGVRRSDGSPTSDAGAPRALATPIGSGRYAIVLRDSIVDAGASSLDVVLPSGRRTWGRIVETRAGSSETVLVHLFDAEPGHEVTDRRPQGHEVVTVMASPPITVAFDDIAELDVENGTAIVDENGRLVGLCRQRGDRGVGVVELDGALDDGDR
jgi:hypothetical protein